MKYPHRIGNRKYQFGPHPLSVYTRVHKLTACGDPHKCVIHARQKHHMSEWALIWRRDRDAKYWERLCPHGVGHPDPTVGLLGIDTVHGCDGCCRVDQIAEPPV
jgi:hypothetical protein